MSTGFDGTEHVQAGEGFTDMNGTGQSSPDAMTPEGPEEQPQSKIQRKPPEISEARKTLVSQWLACVHEDKKHWKDTFAQMRRDQDFAYGRQWSESRWDDDRYTVNITHRHIQQRVAALYARNPKVKATRKEKLLSSVWDGTASGVMLAMQQMQMVSTAPGAMMDPNAQAQLQQSMAVLQEAQQAVQYKAEMDRFGKTLELLYEYNVDEQVHNFKAMLKMTLRRACTVGVGYVKLGFQRVMEMRPEVERQINDITQKMATIERIAAGVQDGVITNPQDPRLEQLRLTLEDLQAQPEQIVREGLVFDYPEGHSIIPDKKTRHLRTFLGADHVTQEYCLSPEEIEEIYGIDLGTHYRAYRTGTTDDPLVSPVSDIYEPDTNKWSFDLDETDKEKRQKDLAVVWEIYCRKDGLVYVVCDGYPDFLREPAAPEVWTERFFPWFPIILNECDHPHKVYPPSDVQLIKDQQKEYNRLREGLREHRIQNRPATAVAAGVLSDDDAEKMVNRPAGALIELAALQPGQRVEDVLQGIRFPGVDPNLYEVNGIFEDVLRAVGVQEANLGGSAGGTATEASVAESSRQSSLTSNVDDLDMTLSDLARAAGQILLAEVGQETVIEVVGPGAMWPELNREQLAKETFLDIEAGSTGKPNQAMEIQNFERLAPILMQIPGISPEMLAKEGIRRLDDRLELSDLYDPNMMSIQAMNQVAGASATAGAQPGPADDPNAQGPEGANNGPVPDQPPGASSEGTQPMIQ